MVVFIGVILLVSAGTHAVEPNRRACMLLCLGCTETIDLLSLAYSSGRNDPISDVFNVVLEVRYCRLNGKISSPRTSKRQKVVSTKPTGAFLPHGFAFAAASARSTVSQSACKQVASIISCCCVTRPSPDTFAADLIHTPVGHYLPPVLFACCFRWCAHTHVHTYMHTTSRT